MNNREFVLEDYLHSYKECFEAMNNLLIKICERVELTNEEIELAKVCDSKYKNMVYHIRKHDPNFKRPK